VFNIHNYASEGKVKKDDFIPISATKSAVPHKGSKPHHMKARLVYFAQWLYHVTYENEQRISIDEPEK